jgi:hypothetical protein
MPAASSIARREKSLLPAALCVSVPGEPAIGVGHIASAKSRVTAVSVSETSRPCRRPQLSESSARAVGHDEQPFPAVAGAGFGRAEYSCRNAVAQPFQSRDEGGELSVRIPRHVLAEDTIRPALGDDAQDLIDEEAVVVGPAPLAGDGVGLAGISRSDAMNDAAPCSSVESGEVRPDRRLIQGAVRHARDKVRGGIGFPLHVSDAARAGLGDADAELEPADSGAEGEDVEGT